MSLARDITVGDSVSHTTTITTEDVENFREGSGDTNPLHVDESYAEETRFDEPIAHGMLVAGVIGSALQKLPGVVVWLGQSLSFEQPVYHGDKVEATVELVEIADTGIIEFETVVESTETGESVITGTGSILVDDE